MTVRKSVSRIPLTLALALIAFAVSGCGYRLAGRRFNNGMGQTIAVPTFKNTTSCYRAEQRIAEAIRRELLQRTRFQVTSENSGDLATRGEIIGCGQNPILFDGLGRASAYNFSIAVKIVITETASGKVALRNDNLGFTEKFELGESAQDFVPEESPAMDRLARQIASAVVASLLDVPQ